MSEGDGMPNSGRDTAKANCAAQANFGTHAFLHAWLLLFCLLHSSTVSADEGVLSASSPDTTLKLPQQQALVDELGEVIVNGQRPVSGTQPLIRWLANLGGKFTLKGNVDRQGKGAPQDLTLVEGSANCVAFGLAPGIRCEIKVLGSGIVDPRDETISGRAWTLGSGMMLFGVEPRSNGIAYMIVDNKGVGEYALGLLFDNTLISKAPCLEAEGFCERMVRITAEPDAQTIRLQIDVMSNQERVTSVSFSMHRVPSSSAEIIQGKPK